LLHCSRMDCCRRRFMSWQSLVTSRVTSSHVRTPTASQWRARQLV